MKKKLAILRFKWKDQQNAIPIWNDNAFNAIFTPQSNVYGVARYWQDCSFDVLDLTGSRVFSWQVHDLPFSTKNEKGELILNQREDVIQRAIQKTEVSGISLEEFDGIVVVFPASLTVGADFGAIMNGVRLKSGRILSGCLLNDGLWQTFIAHEVGHVLGFDHSYGRDNGAYLGYAPYNDQYCIMSAAIFDGHWSPFKLSSDTSVVLETGFSYNEALGPAPSCAILYHSILEFKNSGKVLKLNNSVRQTPQRVRLFASFLGKTNTPILISVPIEPGIVEKTMLIEYRTNKVWDRGFASEPYSGNDTPPSPAIVIHSIRNGIEDSFPQNQTDHVVLEGYLPIPMTGDTDISFFGKRDLGIQVNSVAPDNSYVDIMIGSYLWTSPKRINAQIPESQKIQAEILLEEGIAKNIPIPPNCGVGDFPYKIYSQDNEVKLSAKSSGYIKPFFWWSVNGIQIPPRTPTGQIQVLVNTEFVKADGVIKKNLMASISYTQKNNTLILKTKGSDGNYNLWINVSCDEADTGVIHQPSDIQSFNGTIDIKGQELTMGEDFVRAVAACFRRYIENLPVAILKFDPKKHGENFSKAILLGRRFEADGIQIDKKYIQTAKSLIKELNKELPALAGQLQASIDIIVKRNRINNLSKV